MLETDSDDLFPYANSSRQRQMLWKYVEKCGNFRHNFFGLAERTGLMISGVPISIVFVAGVKCKNNRKWGKHSLEKCIVAVVKRQPSSEISLCAGIFILRLHNFLQLRRPSSCGRQINENHTLWLLLFQLFLLFCFSAARRSSLSLCLHDFPRIFNPNTALNDFLMSSLTSFNYQSSNACA